MKIHILILSFLFSLLANSQTTVKRDTLRVGDSAVVTQTTNTVVTKTGTTTYSYKDTSTSISQYKISVSTPPPTNLAPTARAGNDTTITLPSNSISLNASKSTDPEGQILKFYWRKVTGPVATLVDTNKAICIVSGMVAGTYVFELRAIDPLNLFSVDFINVVVRDVSTPPTGSSFPFSLVKNTGFKPRKFAGTENWNGQFYTAFTGGYQDYYFRFCWTDIEKTTQGNYVWTRFDQEFQKALNVKGKFSFGIMTVCDSDDFLAQEFFNNVSSRYPKYVHDRMQAESVKDYIKNGQWIPNWNSTFFLDRYDALLQAIQAHIVSKGWQDKINYVDIRGYGQWGEWHSVGFGQPVSSMPAGTRPTVATYKRFVDGHIAAFPNYPLVMLMAALDANWLDNTMTPPEVTDYILKAKNNWGLIGIRRDQWGATDQYIKDYFENNNRSWNGGPAFKTLIMERWKYAPLVGEPMGPGSNLSDLQRQVTFYHALSVGNGNYTGSDGASQMYFRNSENVAGYKLAIQSGNINTTSALDLQLSYSIENFGNTPCYENYDIVYELRSFEGATVWSGTSTFKPALKIPGVHPVLDNFKVTGVSLNTTYTLVTTIKNNYRTMPLFNNGQDTNGFITFTNVKF
jgi:hypothetical protein